MTTASDALVLVVVEEVVSFLQGSAYFIVWIHRGVDVLLGNYYLLMLKMKNDRDVLDALRL